ncbi:E3 ubiquitin-protein ligase TRIM7-like [Candoia aspera]|uniref:E3 ubiquitin-protein ligase TRIM7-like n=1 Tax=Candoia aspera TaxID=51853 RepID=UPI002FD7E536
MASGVPVLELLEEATCSICLELFQDPVLVPGCGHNFCRSCLARSWGEAAAAAAAEEASCPQCRLTFRPRDLVANRQLARMAEIAQRCGPQGGEGAGFCGTHQEPLKLFCKDCETLIYLVCDRSPEHRDHRVIPLEEAFQEYQVKVGDCLKAQKEEREKMITYRTDTKQKVWEMLDIGDTLKKYQAKKPFENPVAFPLERKWTIWDYSDTSVFLRGVMKQFRDTLKFGLHLQEAKVILDPDTAHRCLALSEDHQSIRDVAEEQDLPANPKRFENCCYVLGCQGFSRGRRFWEVTVGDGDQGLAVWAVGVARKSVNRKGDIPSGPKGGMWEIVKYGSEYKAWFPPEYPELHLKEEPKRIRVSLNCEGRQVAFFDAQTAALLYMFSDAPWAGETLLPSFFLRNGAYLTLSS